ncbi:MAG: hypothetical protein GYA33_06865, partial [Thermogutta sp.]|nr:hypothetical protein [Thermogutta sp.]
RYGYPIEDDSAAHEAEPDKADATAENPSPSGDEDCQIQAFTTVPGEISPRRRPLQRPWETASQSPPLSR